MKITLPLPARLTSHFVVPVVHVPFDIESFMPWRVGRPYRRAVSAALGSPLLTVTHHRSPWRPAGVTLAIEERHLLRRAQQHVLVSSTAPPHALPTSIQVARAAARAVAQECEGLVIDPLTGITLLTCDRHTDIPPPPSPPPSTDGVQPTSGRVPRRVAGPASGSGSGAVSRPVPGPTSGPAVARPESGSVSGRFSGPMSGPVSGSAFGSVVAGPRTGAVGHRRGEGPVAFPAIGESPVFRLADDWLGWDVQVHGDATCPPWDPADTGACDCLRVTSRGLRRFALPEITLDGAACAHSLCATSLLRRVAHHLVTDHLAFLAAHPDATVRSIDDHVRIATSAGHDGSPFTVHLTPYDTDPTSHGRVGRIGRLKVAPVPGAGQVAYLRADPPPGTGQVTHLKVGPPSGFSGSLNDWLCATHRTAHDMPTVLGCDLADPFQVLAA
ncbi:hypothetical protein ACIBO2_04870 [Nonomuraea sp. NPDC050022]|uniref:hypothetical protein n=1 Tax=unclassified Nonomuraea TaxID=2593643 RepID=UPI0033C9BF33